MTVEGELFPDDGSDNLSSVYRPDWRSVDSVIEQPKQLKFDKFDTFVTHTGTHGDTYFSYGAVLWATLLTMALFHLYCKVLGITSRVPLAFPSVQYTANALGDCDAKLEHRLNVFFISISVMNVALLFALFVTLFVCLRKRQARRAAKRACVGYSLRCVRAETFDLGDEYRPSPASPLTQRNRFLALGGGTATVPRLPEHRGSPKIPNRPDRVMLQAVRTSPLYPQTDIEMRPL
jgi:hypothetical protein